MNDLTENNTLSKEAADFLIHRVKDKANILISGGTGAGKTTFMNALASFIPKDEKITALEHSSELKLIRDHIVILDVPHDATTEEIGQLVRFVFSRDLPTYVLFCDFMNGGVYESIYGLKETNKTLMASTYGTNASQAIERLIGIAKNSPFYESDETFKETLGNELDIVINIMRLPDGSRKKQLKLSCFFD